MAEINFDMKSKTRRKYVPSSEERAGGFIEWTLKFENKWMCWKFKLAYSNSQMHENKFIESEPEFKRRTEESSQAKSLSFFVFVNILFPKQC